MLMMIYVGDTLGDYRDDNDNGGISRDDYVADDDYIYYVYI
jgi:hypothetical protein